MGIENAKDLSEVKRELWNLSFQNFISELRLGTNVTVLTSIKYLIEIV